MNPYKYEKLTEKIEMHSILCPVTYKISVCSEKDKMASGVWDSDYLLFNYCY